MIDLVPLPPSDPYAHLDHTNIAAEHKRLHRPHHAPHGLTGLVLPVRIMPPASVLGLTGASAVIGGTV